MPPEHDSKHTTQTKETRDQESPDLDAEHDPARAKRASRADLMKQQAGRGGRGLRMTKEQAQEQEARAQERDVGASSLEAVRAAIDVVAMRMSESGFAIYRAVNAKNRLELDVQAMVAKQLMHDLWHVKQSLVSQQLLSEAEFRSMIGPVQRQQRAYAAAWTHAKRHFPSFMTETPYDEMLAEPIKEMYRYYDPDGEREAQNMQSNDSGSLPTRPQEDVERDAARANLKAATEAVRWVQLEQRGDDSTRLEESITAMQEHIQVVHDIVTHSYTKRAFGDLGAEAAILNALIVPLMIKYPARGPSPSKRLSWLVHRSHDALSDILSICGV